MIQDIFPHKLYNQYSMAEPADCSDWALLFDGGKVLMHTADDSTYKLPRIGDFPETDKVTYLFTLDQERFYLVFTQKIPVQLSFVDVRTLRSRGGLTKEYVFALMTGKHLADWYRDTRFCGRCGAMMIHSETERAMRCPRCSNTVYPRIMPAVIVGVKNGDSILLTKYRTGFAHNALIAGFTEIGETAEETVAREVMEEVGVRVKNIRYYKSQPWGVANDLLLGYFCEVDGDTEIHMDTGELKYAQWVSRENIELQPDDFSLTNEMMKRFRDGLEQ